MVYGALTDKRCRDGYGKHAKHPITFTAIDGEPVAKVSLGMQRFMIIDVADMGMLEEHSFYAQKRADGQYVARSSQTGQYAHRLVLSATASDVDHVNHMPLDNRKINLRECTSMQNQLARECELVDGFCGLFKIQDESESREWHRGKLATVYKRDVWGFYNPDGSKSEQRFQDVNEAAEARDDAYLEFYEDSEANWHTYSFINWNFLWGADDEKCAPLP